MRVHADPVPATINALRAFFLLPSTVADLGVACRVEDAEDGIPQDWSLRTGPPLVTVSDDGGPVQYPIKRDPTMRILVRARGSRLAKRVAALADGYLRANLPDGMATIRRGGSAFVVTRDSDSGADLASFTLPAVVPMIDY
ncbi:head-tail connector [Mycobacterium phage Weirdo19]|uniref:Head-tail connector n=1 Tax=Mycobacterium phage Weirdo19 TaxID=2601610 RepID=A0A6M2YT71_9CAUD|nr:tail terminator [Mycobacterium phage Weirdo19]QEA10779.1 head-tail connector [Mycobacterium phage Weirdo19]